ncbi:MAG: group 1 glycosyl transferase [Candidatus Gottesmanbacteria bacterium GW2011_GWA2_43_14]|uniref:Group 1 glycosyl transferase n=1 Tax=Candidatus Gottesmanbacteria bacterium GW2011_GWA2_43_14 TaxID=1618443 RepID=A0A0G1GI03_9BACT|nr:MAG: group 1 glycosyl transferase [Candidatus Gottesmanbacteria bacterium GW2011_GWA2_43_14]
MKQIVVLSGGNYYSDLVRIEQMLPGFLSKHYQVLFIEYPKFSRIIRLIAGKQTYLEKVNNQLTVIHTFGLLPCGRSVAQINLLNHRLNYFLVKNLINKKYLLLSFTPEAVLIPLLMSGANRVYYWVIDDYVTLPFWNNPWQKRQFRYLDKLMVSGSDRIIAASTTLYEQYRKDKPQTFYFPTPADLSDVKIIDNEIPGDLKAMEGLKIGFIGAFYDWRIDIDLLLKTAAYYSNHSFIFIGSFKVRKKYLRDRLYSMKNLHFLDYKKPEYLSLYINAFDVCLIPYRMNAYGISAYPVKINEYLYAGKPVVTTALPALKDLANRKLIYWADNNRTFIKYIGKAIRENDPELKKARKKTASANSWQARSAALLKLLEQ